jgi:hypothetical protein
MLALHDYSDLMRFLLENRSQIGGVQHSIEPCLDLFRPGSGNFLRNISRERTETLGQQAL